MQPAAEATNRDRVNQRFMTEPVTYIAYILTATDTLNDA
jgi:hypothetical protein